jgi:CxxC-x17-CxxC domain-containing protein
MLYADKPLICATCGSEFRFTADEQRNHARLGLRGDPRRCPGCRTAGPGPLPRSRRGRGDIGTRELFFAVCSVCGRETQLPFKPRGDRPVYCGDCFGRRR